MSQTPTTLTTAVEKRMLERVGGTPSQKLDTTSPSSEKLNREMMVKTCSRWTLRDGYQTDLLMSVTVLSYLYMARKVLSLSTGTLWGKWKSWRRR